MSLRSDERRIFQRLAIRGRLQIKAGNGFPVFLQASLEDIGFNGFAMRVREGLLPESVVDFSLRTPLLEAPLLGQAKVRHTRLKLFATATTGMEFTSVEKRLVRRLLERSLRRSRRAEFMPFHKRGLLMTLALMPLLIFTSFFTLSAVNTFSSSKEQKREYYESYRQAEAQYLYAAHAAQNAQAPQE